MARILVVDDDEGVRVVMRAILEQDGFTIEEAASGEAALDTLRSNGPMDLVLLDLMMPGVDGYEFLRRLRADSATAATPVVVISAKGAAGRDDALAAGADDYFEKPFSPLALLRLVERRLGPEAAEAGRP